MEKSDKSSHSMKDRVTFKERYDMIILKNREGADVWTRVKRENILRNAENRKG